MRAATVVAKMQTWTLCSAWAKSANVTYVIEDTARNKYVAIKKSPSLVHRGLYILMLPDTHLYELLAALLPRNAMPRHRLVQLCGVLRSLRTIVPSALDAGKA